MNEEAQKLLDKQWPRFEVKCKKCGSTLIELENTMGTSELSGSWGGLAFRCTQCDNNVVIYEN